MRLRLAIMTLALLLFCASPALAGSFTFGWSETSGWLDYAPTNGGATVYADHLEGYAWQENIGWVRLGSHSGGGAHTYANTGASDWGVNRGGATLSGYAWSETAGWIDFNPTGGGVTYDQTTGRMGGWAWGENIGWVRFYPLTRTITASAGNHGGITPTGPTTVLADVPAAFTITPATGYHLLTTVGGTCGGTITSGDPYDAVNGAVYTTTAGAGDCTVAAAFATNTFIVTPSITPADGSNGSITPPAPQTVEYNATTSFTIKPLPGYRVVTPVGGSCPVGAFSGSPNDPVSGVAYTTGAITADCTVAAAFSLLPVYNVTISNSDSTQGIWNENTWVPTGSGSNVKVSEVQERLAGGNVIIGTNTEAGESGDIAVAAPLAWSANQLTLNAIRNISINAVLMPATSATLSLTASGTVMTAGGGKVNFDRSGTGLLTINSSSYSVINDVTALQAISSGLSGKFALGADIDASSITNFVPLGNATTQFTGIFDGLGHTITGLTINRPDTDYIGLFGATGGATLRNVGLVNATVSGRSYVGGLVGQSGYKPASTVLSSAISNAYTTGTVTGTVIVPSNYTGGLVGWDFAGPIDTCFSSATVQGNVYVGGLAGSIYDGDKNHCRISNSYSNGTVHGIQYVGGLVGYSWGYLSSVYSSGFVSADNSTGVGGLVGAGITGIYLTNSFWDKTVNASLTDNNKGTGLSTTDMKKLITFSAWDISASGNEATIWRIYDGQSYPLLRSFLAPLTVTANDATKTYDNIPYSGGNGVSFTPYDFDYTKVFGTPAYSGTSQGATVVGGPYSMIPGGLYSIQTGYDISYVNGSLTIVKATAVVTLSNLTQAWDGTPKIVTAATDPTGLTVDITYDGSPTAPSAVGSHAVVATVNDGIYQGSASGALVITPILTVNVVKTGAGAGTVTSAPSGISCSAGSCSNTFTGTVSLNAVPSALSLFGGWSG